MAKKVFVVLLVLSIPIVILANVVKVGQDANTAQEAVAIAQDGDTVIVPGDTQIHTLDLSNKNVHLIVDDIEPPDYDKPDSTIVGPSYPFPQSPEED